MDSVREILEELGYQLMPDKNGWRSAALYREGDNPTALKIFSNGNWADFVQGKRGNIEDLIQLTLNLKHIDEVKKWLVTKQIELETPDLKHEAKVKIPQSFDPLVIDQLIPDHSFYLNRGISQSTLDAFRGGFCKEGKLKNRYVFPIFGHDGKLYGFSGRDVTNRHSIKWKHIGTKASWEYPLFLNSESLAMKDEIILVESIGDGLQLYEAGVPNFLILFGVDMSLSILNRLLWIEPKKILISTNNDIAKNSVGNEAAVKIYNRLIRYFDKRKLKIKLPTRKDFGDMSKEEILAWKSN